MNLRSFHKPITVSLIVLCIMCIIFVTAAIFDNASANQPFGFILKRPSIEKEDLLTYRPEQPPEEISLDIPDVDAILGVLPLIEEPALVEQGSQITTSYWVYPGNPACSTFNELNSLGEVDQVKPEFATIDENGNTIILTEDKAGCNALSSTNLDFFKAHSQSQFITVSGSGEGFSQLMSNQEKRQNSIDILTSLVNQTGTDGIEIDFEGFSSWTTAEYQSYLDYLDGLGQSLNDEGKQLMIDAPAIYNEGIQNVFEFKYSDFNDLAVDFITIMAYDYQFDFGGGASVTQDQFLIDSITRAKEEIEDDSKIIVGLPTYGYSATEGSYSDIKILTKAQVKDIVGEEKIQTATRIEDSQELIVEHEGKVYVFQDRESIEHKINLVESEDVTQISIWHLGGNPLVEN